MFTPKMRNIFIFLEDKLSTKFLIIRLLILIIIFFPKNLYALSGKEINTYVKKWLASEGIKSNPKFSPKKKLSDCDQNISYKRHNNSFKLIKVTCTGKKPWTIYVKTNANTLTQKKKQKKFQAIKSYQILVLDRSIEKGNYLRKSDLVFVNSARKYNFYNNKEDLVGRKVKQNLRKGQHLQPRHLFKKYSVNEGDVVIIISKFKNTEVSTGGIAMKSANIGDILEVKNSRSGKIVKGTLKKNKKINVFF